MTCKQGRAGSFAHKMRPTARLASKASLCSYYLTGAYVVSSMRPSITLDVHSSKSVRNSPLLPFHALVERY